MCTVSGGGRKCAYVNCENKSKNKTEAFFTFPVKNKERCKLWILNSGRDDFNQLEEGKLKFRTLCAIHFKEKAFTNSSRKRLLTNHPFAVPIPWFKKDDVSDEDEPLPKKKKEFSENEEESNYITCCAQACTNTSENHCLTPLPEDPEKRQQWLSRINRDDWVPSEDSALCEIHFEEDVFEENPFGEKVMKADAMPTQNLNGEAIRSWITFDDSGNIKDEHVRNASGGESNDGDGESPVYIKQEALEPDIEMVEETAGVKDRFEAVYLDSTVEKDDDDIIKTNSIHVKQLNKSRETIVPELYHVNVKSEPVQDIEETTTTLRCPECNQMFEQKWDLEFHLKERHPDKERTKRLASRDVCESAAHTTSPMMRVPKKPSSRIVAPSAKPCSCSHSTAVTGTTQIVTGTTQIVTGTTQIVTGTTQIIPPMVSTSQSVPTIGSLASIGSQLVFIPQTAVNTQPVFLPVAGPSTVVAPPSAPPPPPPTTSFLSCTVDSSETFTISLAQFPAPQRVVIKKKMLEVVEIVEKFKVQPETIVIAHKP